MITKKVLAIIRKIDNGKFLTVVKHAAKLVGMRSRKAYLPKTQI